MTIRGLVFSILGGLLPLVAFASDNADDAALQALMSLLDEQTQIATRTRLNVDYVPGMVSVMHGEEMRQRGYATLWDALASIPGVQKNVDASGQRNLIVRGIGKTSETSKIKILLNDVPLNASISASVGTIFATPVSQIDRIEFIRGPGSAIHGEYALLGVLNVITIKDASSYSVSADSDSGKEVQGVYSFGDHNGFNGSLNFAATASDGADIHVDRDRTPASVISYAPGPINNKTDSVSAIVDLNYANSAFSLQYQQVNRGDHFGINNYLPPPQKQTVISDTVTAVALRHKFELSPDLDANLKLARVSNHNEKNRQFLGVAPLFSGLNSDPDVVSYVDLLEHRSNLTLDLNYRGENHQLFAEIEVSKIEVEDASQLVNLDPVTLIPTTDFSAFAAPVSEDQERKIRSLALQDEYRVRDNVTITAGLRYDSFDDEEDNLAPRLAAVWILGNDNVIKTQLAQSFRPPTLREAGGAIDGPLDVETIETVEFSYIHNSSDRIVRNTLFYSQIDDFITFSETAPFGYRNIEGARVYGYELELEQKLSDRISVDSQLSLLQTEDRLNGEPIYGSTPLTLGVSANYQLSADLLLNLQVNHVAERARQAGDSRDDLASATQTDLTLTMKRFSGVQGLELRAGVRNLLQQQIVYPAPANSYPDDYPRLDDALFWLSLSYAP